MKTLIAALGVLLASSSQFALAFGGSEITGGRRMIAHTLSCVGQSVDSAGQQTKIELNGDLFKSTLEIAIYPAAHEDLKPYLTTDYKVTDAQGAFPNVYMNGVKDLRPVDGNLTEVSVVVDAQTGQDETYPAQLTIKSTSARDGQKTQQEFNLSCQVSY